MSANQTMQLLAFPEVFAVVVLVLCLVILLIQHVSKG